MDPKFREYATRVSFNISLSRNQIYVLYQMSLKKIGDREDMDKFGLQTDNFVPGAKWLGSHGFVTYTPPGEMVGSKRYPWELTETGHHVIALLRIAGLIPEEVVENKVVPMKKYLKKKKIIPIKGVNKRKTA